MKIKDIEKNVIEILARVKQALPLEIAIELLEIDKNLDVQLFGEVLAKLLKEDIIRAQGMKLSLHKEKYDTNKKL